MNLNTLEAIGLVLLAAAMNATYTQPMRVNRKWQWEHSWFAFSLLGVVGVPTLIAIATVPHLWSIYPSVPGKTLAAMALFGAGWGVSLVLFGLALGLVGVAITFSVSLGTSAAAGALVPLASQHPEKFLTRQGALILAALVVIFVGVAICGLAGSRRDQAAQKTTQVVRPRFLRGFLYAFISGFLGSMLNLGLAFGGRIQQAAREHGASLAMMSNAVWIPCLYAGFIPGVLYCYYLMRKRRNVAVLKASGTWFYWWMGAAMGVLWFGSIILYSISTLKLGSLGTSVGWPLFLSAIVIASTLVGVLAGEWSHSGKQPIRIMVLGVACLVVAIGVLSQVG